MPDYLLSSDNFRRFSILLKQYSHVFLFLDYDGTLAPFCDNPADAVPLPGTGDLLDKLCRKHGITTGIISGRPVVELKKMLKYRKLYYAGLHGLEIVTLEGETIKGKTINRAVHRELVRLKSVLESLYIEK